MDARLSDSLPSVMAAGLTRRTALGRLLGASAAGALLAGARPADALAEEMPNRFELSSETTTIVYDTGGVDGQPRLTYRGPIGVGPIDERPIESRTAEGDGIRVEQSSLGQLVRVYLDAMPDAATFYLTLLLPEFNPTPGGAEPIPFSTLAILLTELTTLEGPAVLEGPLQEYAVIELEGTAEVVMS
jgi:hypothetical protein